MSAFAAEYTFGDEYGDGGFELGEIEFGRRTGMSLSVGVDGYMDLARNDDRNRSGDVESCESVGSVRNTKVLPRKESGDVELGSSHMEGRSGSGSLGLVTVHTTEMSERSSARLLPSLNFEDGNDCDYGIISLPVLQADGEGGAVEVVVGQGDIAEVRRERERRCVDV